MVRFRVLALALSGCGSTPDDPGLRSTCTGDCRVTALTAELATTRVLDRAVFGFTETGKLHVEAYLGGLPGCPSQTNPMTDYALVIPEVAMPTGTESTTSPATVIDFTGDLLEGELGEEAGLVIIHATAASLPDFVALDVHLEFTGGTISGHLFAVHCTSLEGLGSQ